PRNKLTPRGRVVLHPILIRYTFHGDLHRSVDGVLDAIERRLSWQPQRDRPLLERVHKVGDGILALKEVEYLGRAYSGKLSPRLRALTEAILQPMEREWLNSVGSGPAVERVKKLRTAILPDLVEKELAPADREHRWAHLADCYLAQQLDCYPD